MTTTLESLNSSDYSSRIDFIGWINLLARSPFSEDDRQLFLENLSEHPLWVHQIFPPYPPALIQAVEYGHLDVVRQLIQSNCPIGLSTKTSRNHCIN